MAIFNVTCEWCGRSSVKKGKRSQPPRFCDAKCSAKWRMSRADYVASLNTPKHRAAASVNMRRWRESPEGQATLQAHLKGPSNPFNNPTVRVRAAATLREQGYPMLTGGNGQLTVPQALLAERLGWPTEVVVPTGRKRPWPYAYKIDIASLELRIAIEVDGESHRSPAARERDARKDSLLTAFGWTVLRFSNKRVLAETDAVVAEVLTAVRSTTSRQAPATT